MSFPQPPSLDSVLPRPIEVSENNLFVPPVEPGTLRERPAPSSFVEEKKTSPSPTTSDVKESTWTKTSAKMKSFGAKWWKEMGVFVVVLFLVYFVLTSWGPSFVQKEQTEEEQFEGIPPSVSIGKSFWYSLVIAIVSAVGFYILEKRRHQKQASPQT